MSLHKPLISSKELNNHWKKYSQSKNEDFFLKICELGLDDLPEFGKKLLKKSKFLKALPSVIDNQLRIFTASPVSPELFLSHISPALDLLRHSLSHKEFKNLLDATSLEKFFDHTTNISSIPMDLSYSLLKLQLSLLALISAAIEHCTSQDYARLTFIRVDPLLEQTLQEPINHYALVPINISEITRLGPDSEEEFTDLLGAVLELYLLSMKNWQNPKSPSLLNPLFGSVLQAIKTAPGFAQITTETTACLAAKKFILVLQILRNLSRHKDFCIQFINEFREKFKDIFISCLYIYSNLPLHFQGSFITDQSSLASLFLATFNAFTGSPDSLKQIEMIHEIPVVMFLWVFSSVRYMQGIIPTAQAGLAVKCYCLEFIKKLYLEPEKVYWDVDSVGIQDLILSYEFFLVDDHVIQPLWSEIWYRLIKKCTRLKVISRSLVEGLKSNLKKEGYLNRFYNWLMEFAENQSSVVQEMLKQGLGCEMLRLISDFNDDETVSVLLNINTLLIRHCNSPAIDSSAMLNVILNQTLVISSNFLEYCRVLIVKLLILRNYKGLHVFLDFCRCQTQPEILKCLVQSLLEALTHKEMKEFVSLHNFEENIFITLTKALQKNISEVGLIQDLWSNFADCSEIVLSAPSALRAKQGKFNFWPVVKLLRQDFYNDIRDGIITKTMETFLNVLMGKSDIIIEFPEIIPLVLDCICFSFESLQNDVKAKAIAIIQNQINMQLLCKHGLAMIILYHLNSFGDVKGWKNYQNTLTNAISGNFKISELKKMILMIKSGSSANEKIAILQIIEKSLVNLEFNKDPNDCLYFTSKSVITRSYKPEFYAFKEENSIVAWIYPETFHKSNIFLIRCTRESIQVSISHSHLLIQIKDTILETTQELKAFSWNMLTINISLNFIKNNKIAVYINKNLTDFKEKKPYKISKKNNISSISLGDFTSEDSGFSGKISEFYVFRKCLDEDCIKSMYNLHSKYSLIRFPQNVSKELTKTLTDLRSSLIVNMIDEIANSPSLPHGIYSLRNSNIKDAIEAYGIGRLLLELAESCKQPEIMEMFCKVFYQVFKDLNPELRENVKSIRYFAEIITNCEVTPEICEVYIRLINTCRYAMSHNLLENLLYHPELIVLPQKSASLFLGLLEKYKIFRPFSIENFYQYCLLILNSSEKDVLQYIRYYISEDPEEKYKDMIAYVLDNLLNKNYFDMIKAILKVISKFSYDYSIISPLPIALLHILEKTPENFWFLKKSINLLILKNKNAEVLQENTGDSSTLEAYINIIQKSLPNLLSKQMVIFLLSKGFEQNTKLQKIRYFFIDIVLWRIKYIEDSSILNDIISVIQDNQSRVIEYIFDRDNFPTWLVQYYICSKKSRQALEMIYFLSALAFRLSGFAYFRDFFVAVDDLNIYASILGKIVEEGDYIVNYLKIFSIFQKDEIIKDSQVYEKCFEILLDSESFMKKVGESVYKMKGTDVFYNKPINTSDGRSLASMLMSYLLFGIKLYGYQNREFKYFKVFISHNQIQYFSRYQNTEFANLENFLAIQGFSYLVNLYMQSPEIFKEVLFDYIRSVSVLDKINDFTMNKKNKELIFEGLYSNIYPESEKLEIKKQDSETSIKDEYWQFIRVQEQFYKRYLENPTEIEQLLASEDFQTYFDVISGIINKTIYPEENLIKTFSSDVETARKVNPLDEKIVGISNEMIFTQWEIIYIEDIQRYQYKQHADFMSSHKLLKKLKSVLENPPPVNQKIRQVYDKFYRWAFLKPLTSEISLKHPPPIPADLNFKISHLSSSDTENSSISRGSASTYSQSIASKSTAVFGKVPQKPPISLVFAVERIKIQGSNYGRAHISSVYLDLRFDGDPKPYSGDYESSALTFTASPKKIRYVWYPYEISEVVLRRFIHRHTALELILKSGKSYFLNFFQEKDRNEASRFMETWPGVKIQHRKRAADLDQNTLDWKSGRISNFEYLMLLNKHSGRSNNDLSQYPVFPWVLKDYSRAVINYEDPEIYRNLRYPVGAQTEEARNTLSKKYANWQDEEMEAFHFGSHYSNSGIVLHYMLRIEPYTSQSRELQGGQFDVADRLFISMNMAWKSVTGSSGDVKELIPEVFYNPFVFTSYSGQEFGRTQKDIPIVHVKPPAWAASNWDFIVKHRNCLESAVVSRDLSNWIDLIFGFRQYSKPAEEYCNLFHAMTYGRGFKRYCETHPDELQGIVEQVYHFGQTPMKIFKKKPHPCRDEISKAYSFHKFFYDNPDGDLIFKRSQKIEPKKGKVHAAFFLESFIITVKSLEESLFVSKYTFKEHLEMPLLHNEYQLQHYSKFLESEAMMETSEYFYDSLQIQYTSNTFAVFLNRYLVSGLDNSNTLAIHNFKGELVCSLFSHTALITAVAATAEHVFSAGLDSIMISWKWSEQGVFARHARYFGHDSPILHLKVLESYQAVVSASMQGLLLVHDIRTGECLGKVRENVTCIDVHEIGIIGIFNSQKVMFFGVNGDKISKYRVYNILNSIRFSLCGGFVIECYDKFMVFREFMKPQEHEFAVEDNISGVSQVLLHPSEKTIYCFMNSSEKNENSMALYWLASKKQIIAQQNIIEEFR